MGFDLSSRQYALGVDRTRINALLAAAGQIAVVLRSVIIFYRKYT
jgi:hypothetical protein